MAPTTPTKANSPEKTYGLSDIKEFFADIIDLKKGVDKQGTIEEIKAKKSMSGANAWMLMCSIIIASIGLDRDSDAVIIGAMLISPLMSPILGIGLGIGINDKEVVKKSFLHFSAAVLIALITSYIYFRLSPFANDTPSIVSRTEPLTLDVIVAIFGGFAGIVSIARKDISTTLPGVAIATALMPPLCVTGYGLATDNMDYAQYSFYLFILNTSFICIATYVVVRYLRFPYRRYVNPKERTRNRIIVVIFSLLIVIPSFFILNSVLEKKAIQEEKIQTKQTLEKFAKTSFGEYSADLDSWFVKDIEANPTLVLRVSGTNIKDEKKDLYKNALADLGLPGWEIEIVNYQDLNPAFLKDLETMRSDIEQIASSNIEQLAIEQSIQKERNFLDSLKISNVSQELRVLFDNLGSISYSESTQINSVDTMIVKPSFTVSSSKKLPETQILKMKEFLEIRLSKKDIAIFPIVIE